MNPIRFSPGAVIGFLIGVVAIILLWNTRLRPFVILVVVIIVVGWVLRGGPEIVNQLRGASAIIGGKKR